MPIVQGAVYTVSIDNTGLLVHPGNEIARKAVDQMTSGRELYLTIARIQRRKSWIKESLPSLRNKPIKLSDSSLREGQGKAYWNHKKEIEMTAIEFSEGTKRVNQRYYYFDEDLICVDEEYRPCVSTDQEKEINKESVSQEESRIERNHYYFENRRMIKWVNNAEKEIDPKSQKFMEAEGRILERSDGLLSKSKQFPLW